MLRVLGRKGWLACGVVVVAAVLAAASCAQLGARVAAPEAGVLAALPMDPQAAPAAWTVTGDLRLVDDAILGRKAYQIDSGKPLELRSVTSFSGAYVVEALVRFPSYTRGREGTAMLGWGVTGEPGKAAAACSFSVSCRGRSGFDATASVSPELSRSTEDAAKPKPTSVSATERFAAETISPLWDRDFRLGIETGMAKLPKGSEVWRRLRAEVRPDRTMMYHNGMVVGDYRNLKPIEGSVTLSLVGEARLAGLEVRQLDAPEGLYVPVGLDGICNALGPVEMSALALGGDVTLVEGIPFVFPIATKRADHVDIGESEFRYRMDVGYVAEPTTTWPFPTQLDPARIMLKVPKYAYRRAWIVAASDGDQNSTPVLTLRFFRVYKGWALDSTVRVPQFMARTGPRGARRIDVTTRDGGRASLWLMPIDIDPFWLSSDFREEDVLNIELTKEVQDWRMFPDPSQYDSFQAGLPSAVQLYGLTLEKAPVSVIACSDRPGQLYTDPEKPVWIVNVSSQLPGDTTAEVQVDITDPYGKKVSHESTAAVPAGGSTSVRFEPGFSKYGLHSVVTTVACEGVTQSRPGALLLLPPDRRKEDGKTTRWGLWNWGGGHGTNPNPDDNLRLLWALGARSGSSWPYELRQKYGVGPRVIWQIGAIPPFAEKNPYDPAEYAAFSDEFGKQVVELKKDTPDLEYVAIFGEWSISLRVTHGVPPYAFGEPWYEYTDAEKENIRVYGLIARAAFEGARKYAPEVKLLLGWAGPLFSVPFMREGFPKELVDGFGLDAPQFERMPERPPRAVEMSNLYWLKPEAKRLGYEDKELVFVEGPCPSSHRLALGHRVQADSVVRTAVLGLAHGVDRFLFCWTLHDCEGYWGSQHYGCVGKIGRRPEYNPKPAAAAYATMTQMLDQTHYDGWIPTGSRTAYCVRFKGPDRLVYCLWTIQGSRPVALTAAPGSNLVMVDENGNEFPLQLANGAASVTITPTPVWVVARQGGVEKAQVGAPTYSDTPGKNRVVLEDFEKSDWLYSRGPNTRYEGNNWDVVRRPGAMRSQRVESQERGSKVWQLTLTGAPADKPLVEWYGVFARTKPVVIPGKARALGIWAKGNSGWGRIVYELVDAKGEVYLSCGTKDDWNCDDTHSWSYLNFDGWRYMEFPLPANSPGDNFREKDSVWWGHSAEGVVDLPLSISKVMVEMQSHQLHVDQVLPVEHLTVELDDLMAVYDGAEMTTDKPVRVQKAAAPAPIKSEGEILPNPLKDLAQTGVGAATQIVRFYPPAQYFDGTRVHVSIKPVEGATEYQVWVSAYPDGRGAQSLIKTKETEPLVSGLKPEFPLYFSVTYTDADGKGSKPSEARRTVLKDEFPMK